MLPIETPRGQSVGAEQPSRCMDLTLLRSGEHFLADDLIEVARWGHFAKADYPWEVSRRFLVQYRPTHLVLPIAVGFEKRQPNSNQSTSKGHKEERTYTLSNVSP